jgi:hypothetical protein
MLRIDGNKLQEIKDHYQEMAKREIAQAVNDPETDIQDDDIEAIKNKYKYQSNQKISEILKIGPEKLFKMGFALDANGWRTGYTKAPIEKRVQKRRTQNKLARKTRQAQRK